MPMPLLWDANAIWGADPKPPISPIVTGCRLIWENAHAPYCETLTLYGKCPMPSILSFYTHAIQFIFAA